MFHVAGLGNPPRQRRDTGVGVGASEVASIVRAAFYPFPSMMAGPASVSSVNHSSRDAFWAIRFGVESSTPSLSSEFDRSVVVSSS
jgi:hypothetical protein